MTTYLIICNTFLPYICSFHFSSRFKHVDQLANFYGIKNTALIPSRKKKIVAQYNSRGLPINSKHSAQLRRVLDFPSKLCLKTTILGSSCGPPVTHKRIPATKNILNCPHLPARYYVFIIAKFSKFSHKTIEGLSHR